MYLGVSPVRISHVSRRVGGADPRHIDPAWSVATLSSTNEVIIRLGGDAPDIINGVVKVLTTAKSQDPELRIPVIRYSRRAPGPASSS